jgi:mRNA interferase MazF
MMAGADAPDSARGDLVTVVLHRSQGKPRPAMVIQSDLFRVHPTVTLLPVTGELIDAPLLRVTVEPTTENGLMEASQVMLDNTQTVARTKIGKFFGHLEENALLEVNRALAVFLGFA